MQQVQLWSSSIHSQIVQLFSSSLPVNNTTDKSHNNTQLLTACIYYWELHLQLRSPYIGGEFFLATLQLVSIVKLAQCNSDMKSNYCTQGRAFQTLYFDVFDFGELATTIPKRS